MEETPNAASHKSGSPKSISPPKSGSPKSDSPKFTSAKSGSHKSASIKSEQPLPDLEKSASHKSEEPLPDIEKSEIPDLEATHPAINNAATQHGTATNPNTDPRPYSEAFSDTITIDDGATEAATDLNLDDDEIKKEERNSTINPDLKIKGEVPIAPPPAYEKLAQKNPKATDSLSITLGPPMIILFDIVVPCIIYYVWFDKHRAQWVNQCRDFESANSGTACNIPKPEYDRDILGYAILSFGFGEVYILIARVWRLLKYRDLCAPLLSRSKWELDATSWVYGVAMICALIPFVVGSTLEIPELYLYSPGFLMTFLAILMLLTLIPIKTPYGINSHARGTPLRPFIYYAAEDFIAVDGLQDREFRVRYNARYESNKSFRRLFLWLTLWWISGVVIYLGCLSAVIWSLEFHYAFGLSLGVLFAYIVIWALVSYWWVQIEMRREKRAYEAGAVSA